MTCSMTVLVSCTRSHVGRQDNLLHVERGLSVLVLTYHKPLLELLLVLDGVEWRLLAGAVVGYLRSSTGAHHHNNGGQQSMV